MNMDDNKNDIITEKVNKALTGHTQKYIEKTHDYLLEQYKDLLPDNRNTNYKEALLKRVLNISSIKLFYDINHLDPIIIVFKLYDNILKKETNYGILFAFELIKIPSEIRDILFLKNKDFIHGKYAFTYFSFCPSLISCDGEYRNKIVRFVEILRIRDYLREIYNDIIEHTNVLIKKRSWYFYVSQYTSNFSTNDIKNVNIELDHIIKSENYSLIFLSFVWFLTIYNEYNNLTESHINTNFKQLILNYYEIDKEFIVYLYKKYPKNIILEFRDSLVNTTIRSGDNEFNRSVACGFKMIPLNISEAANPFDLRFSPWREYFISNKLSDFIINLIAPGIPIFGNYMYVKNTKKGMYDNRSQFDRLKNSEIANDTLHLLYEAQKNTYFASGYTRSVDKTTKRINQWINNKFKKLYNHIGKPIDYALNELIMSDISLIFIGENVGRTFADLITLIPNNDTLHEKLQFPLLDKGYDYFCKYIFELLYTLLALNKRLGIIHGDLHLNNATIGNLYQALNESIVNQKVTENYVVYVISEDNYYFKNDACTASIIDFSRSIMHPNYYELVKDSFVNTSVTSSFEKTEQMDKTNLLNLYLQLFPNKENQRDEYILLFKKYFDEVFKLLTAIDIYMFSYRLHKMINKISESYKTGKKCIELLTNIIKYSETYITSEMNHLLDNPMEYREKNKNSLYPNQVIIEKCFKEFISKEELPVNDAYNLENEFKYVSDVYKTQPEGMKTIKVREGEKIITDEAYTKIRINNGIARERLSKESYDVIKHNALKYLIA